MPDIPIPLRLIYIQAFLLSCNNAFALNLYLWQNLDMVAQGSPSHSSWQNDIEPQRNQLLC